MRAVVQRVTEASVTVNGEKVSQIGPGLLVLLGVGKGDTEKDVDWMADKLPNLRIFEDEQGKMNKSLLDTTKQLIVVSQFTLYGDARKGRRPSWTAAAPAPVAEPLVSAFVDALRSRGALVETGRFRAHMLVESVNNGPRTVLLEL